MQDTDLEAMDTVRKEFDEIAELIESDFSTTNQDMKKRINLYFVVYTAATRSKLQHVDEHYAAHRELYVIAQDILTGYMTKYKEASLADLPPEKVFQMVVRRWKNYKPMKRWIQLTFNYLSRFYIEHQDKPSLEAVALSIFYHQLFKNVVEVMTSTILELVHKERNGEDVDRGSIQAGIELFSKMSFDPAVDVYRSDFLAPYIEATANYYQKAARLWIATDSATDYLEKTEQKMNEERQRCKLYFASTAEKLILERVAQELLAAHQQTLLRKPQSGFASLLLDMRSDHIRRFCSMFSIVPDGLVPMSVILKEHCTSEGNALITTYSTSEKTVDFKGYVTGLISLQQKYMKLLSSDLSGLPIFQIAIKEAFEAVVNKGITVTSEAGDGNITCCELMSSFCDSVVRQTTEKYTDEEVEAIFDGVVSLLTYISDKDVFQHHARIHMSSRLLANVTSDEQEKVLIMRIKTKCGTAFTSHFEGMLNDRNLSNDYKERFKTYCENNDISTGVDFSSQVLTTGFWPSTFSSDEILPPASVADLMKHFEAFYAVDTRHRVLKWTMSYGSATLIAHFNQVKELQMTPAQGAVLLAFNSGTLTANEVAQQVKIDMDELKRILGSFVKIKILLRDAPSPLFTGTDTFAVNGSFSSARRKMQVPAAAPRISVAQSKRVAATLDEDRKPALDACIVRIMKSRRTLPHQELVAQCVQQLSQRFQPDPKLIKLRIEDLIQREYLERDGTSYKYLA